MFQHGSKYYTLYTLKINRAKSREALSPTCMLLGDIIFLKLMIALLSTRMNHKIYSNDREYLWLTSVICIDFASLRSHANMLQSLLRRDCEMILLKLETCELFLSLHRIREN